MKQTSAVQSDLKMIKEENVGLAITLQRKLADGEFPGGYSHMAWSQHPSTMSSDYVQLKLEKAYIHVWIIAI